MSDELTDLLNNLPGRAVRKYKVPFKPHPRYLQAHEKDFATKYPVAYTGGHYFKTKQPDCRKANGLTQSIINFLLWNGHRATRVSSTGRMIGQKNNHLYGGLKQKYIPGTTRKGAADISATIKGRSIMIEVKVGADKPSEHQLKEQELERKAGGIYEFCKTFEDFLILYDSL